jgi:transcription initiation factor TFIIH subunit 2
MSKDQTGFSHTWEQVKSDANWHAIHEDEDGNIIATTADSQSLAEQIRVRRKRLNQLDHAQSSRRILRDMIRYMYLVLDLSDAMYEKDASLGFGPNKNRLDIMLQLAMEFTDEYFDQNPLSHLGIIICKNGEAQVLSLLSGSKRSAVVALGAIREGVTTGLVGNEAGEFSLQNGLEVAGRSLGHMPKHGSREVLVIVGALSTCDPGDVLVETLPRLLGANIRVNCLAMCAEIHVCRKISETSGGIMGVALDGRHMKDLLLNFIAPPPALLKEQDGTQMTCVFMPMGFPTRLTEDVPTLIHATVAMGTGSVARNDKLIFAKTSYVCPRCKAKASEIPTDCAVCGLKLVLAPHLARSFHHLFPVSPFSEIPEDFEIANIVNNDKSINVVVPNKVTSSFQLPPIVTSSLSSHQPDKINSFGFKTQQGMNNIDTTKEIRIDSSILFNSQDCDRCCFSCLKVIGVQPVEESDTKKNKSKTASNPSDSSAASLRFQCPDCKNVFCADCDSFLHGTLHNCPGCLCK